MTIEYNKVTWYSKLLALIIFIAMPFVGFYLGVKYQQLRMAGYEGRIILQNQQKTTDSVGWKIYRNDKYGFEIKYPQGWYFREFQVVGSPHDISIGFDSRPLPDNYGGVIDITVRDRSIDDAITEAHGGMYESTPFVKDSINVNGQNAVRLKYEDNTESIWISHGGYTYSFTGISDQEGMSIFSTFKFTK